MNNETLKNNPLLCDIETGMCETTGETIDSATNNKVQSTKKSVKLIYYTDPICSSCWGIEPQLRKLKLEYADAIEIVFCPIGAITAAASANLRTSPHIGTK